MSDFKMPEKLPILRTQADRDMTEDDWKVYFECRKKYDRPMSIDEYLDIADKGKKMRINGATIEEVAKFRIDNYTIINPKVAYIHKCLNGLKSVQRFNLYAAKKEYPNEF